MGDSMRVAGLTFAIEAQPELEARIIEGAVQESPSREWGKGSGVEAALCPKCAVPLQARGKHKRTLQGNGGESVTLKRTYGTCPKCGEGLFPPG